MYLRLLHDETGGGVIDLLDDLNAAEAGLVDLRLSDQPVPKALLDEPRLSLRCALRTHEHVQLLFGQAEAVAALGVPIAVHRLPAAAGRVLNFGPEHASSPPPAPCRIPCLPHTWNSKP